MNKYFIGLLAALLSISANATVDFTCSYRDSYKVEKRGKIRTKYGKPIVKIKGTLRKSSGGHLAITSAYLFGSGTRQRIHLYRAKRSHEKQLKYAKFHNKSPQQVQEKTWLPTYMRFSLPKTALKGMDSGFRAYFGFFRTQADHTRNKEEDLEAQGVPTEEDRKAFAQENEEELEFRLWCKS